MTNVHNSWTLTLEDLADNLKIAKQISEYRKLAIYEGLIQGFRKKSTLK